LFIFTIAIRVYYDLAERIPAALAILNVIANPSYSLYHGRSPLDTDIFIRAVLAHGKDVDGIGLLDDRLALQSQGVGLIAVQIAQKGTLLQLWSEKISLSNLSEKYYY
jgi:hypothetical protein